MAQNNIQFQKGVSLLDFIKDYGTDKQCELSLAKLRWPNGFQCESCDHKTFCYIESRKLFQCTRCKHQTSVTRDTVFHSTKLPLTKWFLAIFLISQSKNGISALTLKRHIGVSYKTAWSVKHKLMQVMVERDTRYKLSGLVVADDAYLGGQLKKGKRGRGSENKQPFIAAVELNEQGKPIHVKLTPVKSFTKSEVKKWASDNLKSGCCVTTDGLACFNAFSNFNRIKHIKVIMKEDPETGEKPYFPWLSTIMGNVKSAITGTYRSSRKGYDRRYLAEFQYRLNRRFNLESLFKGFIRTASQTAPLPGKLLKRAVNYT